MSTLPTVPVQQRQPGCLLTLIWFVLVGWWASALWIGLAWTLVVLIITMPLGLIMINMVPLVATLRQPATEYTVTAAGGLREQGIPQHPFLLRALYFILIGWWLSAAWLAVSWAASVTLIGIPLAIWMYNRVPAITTLRRY
ncbi:MAG: YccF domain-containing protein [Chloroflexi bacterium]|nr:YccF domain-containing protein [Chloroflexota bacterium]